MLSGLKPEGGWPGLRARASPVIIPVYVCQIIIIVVRSDAISKGGEVKSKENLRPSMIAYG